MSFDEVGWWKTDNRVATSTYHEETKQIVYASCMGLVADWDVAHPPTYDLEGRSVIDIGGGPVSLLLKCVNYSEAVVVDPGEYPSWVRMRYRECDIEYWPIGGEKLIGGHHFDEAWIYNCLQHVEDPELVIHNARRAASLVRLFEWVNIAAYDGHPHELRVEDLERWLGAKGAVTELAEQGCFGTAFSGVFS